MCTAEREHIHQQQSDIESPTQALQPSQGESNTQDHTPPTPSQFFHQDKLPINPSPFAIPPANHISLPQGNAQLSPPQDLPTLSRHIVRRTMRSSNHSIRQIPRSAYLQGYFDRKHHQCPSIHPPIPIPSPSKAPPPQSSPPLSKLATHSIP